MPASSNGPIVRTNLFKVPNKEDVPALVDAYEKFNAEAKKDGKPYVLNCFCGPTHDDRNDGFDFMATVVFAAKDVMDFYDNECQAHAALKASLKGRTGGPPKVIYYQSAFSNSA